VATSRYHHQIERYLELFPQSHLLVVFADDLGSRRVETFGRICAFLGIEPEPPEVALDREFNVSGSIRLAKRPVTRRLTGGPTISRLAARIPGPVRPLIHLATRRRPPERSGLIPDGLAGRLLDELRPDTRALASFFGRDLSEWETWTPPVPSDP